MADPEPAASGPSAHRRFSGAEHRQLEAILDDVGRHFIPWLKVVARLKEAGFPERTTKSVRNHHLRMRRLSRAQPGGTNICRVCLLPQRGHVCRGPHPAPDPDPEDAEA
tara:strand:- start:195 stop:521 length:327 start_codon:yes stop_codon:yes gene_type:complete